VRRAATFGSRGATGDVLAGTAGTPADARLGLIAKLRGQEGIPGGRVCTRTREGIDASYCIRGVRSGLDGARQHHALASGDAAAVLGLIGLVVALPLGYRWCEVLMLGRRASNSEAEARAEAAVLMRKLYWPFVAALLAVPGLWIGTTARSPLLIAGCFYLSFVGGGSIVRRLTPRPAGDPLRGPFVLGIFLRNTVLLLGATLLGVGLRVLFGW
jgi:hypothetical protein